jgi:stage III sporulation protein AD
MNIIQISILAVITTVLATLLKKNAPDYSIYLGLIFGIIVVGCVIGYINEITEIIMELVSKFDLNIEFFNIIIKIIAISYICEFASSVCVDAGERSNALKVEFAGKIIIIALTVPIIVTVAELLLSLV